MYIKTSRIRDNAKMPRREHPSDAGADVFWCPENPELCKGGFFLEPGTNYQFPTGLKMEIPHGWEFKVEEKSGLACKQILVGACVVDSGFKGEVFIDLHNTGKETMRFEVGQKTAQIVLQQVNSCFFLDTPEEELYENPVTISERGEGGFGSTGLE